MIDYLFMIFIYILIGILIGDSSQVKGGGKVELFSYIVCALLWPFILLHVFIEIIDQAKREARKK